MTKTVQLPFFLSSDRGDDRNAAGNRFRVQLRPSVDIPRKAKNTRAFIQEASVVYSMKNIDSSNKSIVFVVNYVEHIVPSKRDYTIPLMRSQMLSAPRALRLLSRTG